MPGTAFAISEVDVETAAARLRGVAHRTPVFESRRLNERLGGRVLLKAENLQRTGSFKFRGGFNAIASLDAERRARGVVSYSSGNHAQGLSLAAALHDVSVTIVMPSDAPPNKMMATKAYGAEIVTYDRYAEKREQAVEPLIGDRTLIKPYDEPMVMAGQGTVALELIEDHPDLDALVVCLGGGGLLSGCATIAAARQPGIEIYGVEPLPGDDHRLSRDAGRRIEIDVPVTIADGQQTTSPGELTWPINNALVTDFLAVTDAEIVGAMRLLFEQCKIVAEPSGATALAAVLHGRVPVEGRTVGVTISGGNVTAARFAELVLQD